MILGYDQHIVRSLWPVSANQNDHRANRIHAQRHEYGDSNCVPIADVNDSGYLLLALDGMYLVSKSMAIGAFKVSAHGNQVELKESCIDLKGDVDATQ